MSTHTADVIQRYPAQGAPPQTRNARMPDPALVINHALETLEEFPPAKLVPSERALAGHPDDGPGGCDDQ